MIGRDYITRQLIKEKRAILWGLWDGKERRAVFRVPVQYQQRDLPDPVEIRGVHSHDDETE